MRTNTNRRENVEILHNNQTAENYGQRVHQYMMKVTAEDAIEGKWWKIKNIIGQIVNDILESKEKSKMKDWMD